MRVPVYARGRGFGRGRVMPQRGGFQAAKIRKRVLGFGNVARGKGNVGNVTRGLNRKPIGTLNRTPAQAASTSKSPGAVGQAKQSPRGIIKLHHNMYTFLFFLLKAFLQNTTTYQNIHCILSATFFVVFFFGQEH